MSSRPLPQTTGSGGGSGIPAGARRSYALEHLSEHLSAFEGGQVIDIGGAFQSNIDYVTGMGHRLYADDLLASLDLHFTGEELREGRFPDEKVEAFLDSTFDFPDLSVDGVLAWDRLQFLPLPLGEKVVDRLFRVLVPDGLLLAMFHPDGISSACPQLCRVADTRHLGLAPASIRRPVQPFSPRAIERFFHRFQSLKFYLTRENLQEVIIRR